MLNNFTLQKTLVGCKVAFPLSQPIMNKDKSGKLPLIQRTVFSKSVDTKTEHGKEHMEVGIVFRIYLENIMTITSNNKGRATALPFFYFKG
ncbi:MAG: hypothetical protein CMI60_22865 [Parvibaculum sp.]|nr:hypothetical protein [Parvibaculum sp.]